MLTGGRPSLLLSALRQLLISQPLSFSQLGGLSEAVSALLLAFIGATTSRNHFLDLVMTPVNDKNIISPNCYATRA